MAAVFPRHRGTARPAYLPTAIQQRMTGELAPEAVLAPSDTIPQETVDILARLIPPPVHPIIPLPPTPIPTRVPKIYNPNESKQDA